MVTRGSAKIGTDGAIAVVVVDDHAMFAESLARLLETEKGIVLEGISSTVAEGLELVRRTNPDVVILDYMLPDSEGASAISAILAAAPRSRVLVLTGFGDSRVLASAIDAGCSGFLTKDQAASDLVQAVRELAQGEIHIPPGLLKSLLPARSTRPVPASGAGESLTNREKEVLGFLARGMTTQGIAKELDLSVHTVRTHVQNVIGKLRAHSKLEAVTIAAREGLVDVWR